MKTLVLVLAAFGLVGCLGPNNLYRKLHNWNARIEPDIVAEGVFVVGLPIHWSALVLDVLVFNPISYWKSSDVIADPGPFPGFYYEGASAPASSFPKGYGALEPDPPGLALEGSSADACPR
jgi:hypothetical protein